MILRNLKNRIYTSFLLLILVILIFNYNLILISSLIILGVISVIEFFNIANKIYKNNFYLFISNIFFIIFVSSYCFMFFFFSNFIQLKIILYCLLLSCAASDIGGFVVGSFFKGPKITKISPNKTISGIIGSLIFTILTFSGLIFYFTTNVSYNIILVGFITSLTCQLGDLFFSFLKRKAKIKDTGNILPGHGGILDRLDGIFIGIPIGFIALISLY